MNILMIVLCAAMLLPAAARAAEDNPTRRCSEDSAPLMTQVRKEAHKRAKSAQERFLTLAERAQGRWPRVIPSTGPSLQALERRFGAEYLPFVLMVNNMFKVSQDNTFFRPEVTVKDTLTRMSNKLNGPIQFACSSRRNRRCRNWAAYVMPDEPARVYLCPSFFENPSDISDEDRDEERIRTLIHESAHLAGVGESSGESYDLSYSCRRPGMTDAPWAVADTWALLVACLNDPSIDETMVIQGTSGGGSE